MSVYPNSQKPQIEDIQIISLLPENWQKYKELRLEILKNDYTPFAWTLEESLEFTDQKWQEMAISGHKRFAVKNNKLIGMLDLVIGKTSKSAHLAVVISVYVNSEFRNQGIAKMLFEDIEKYAKNQGVEILRLNVLVDNLPAKNLYKKLGFVKIGDLPKAMKHKNIYYNEIQMQKEI